MLQTYITAMPLQHAAGLKQVRYAPESAIIPQDTIATSFPICQVIHNTLRDGDQAKVIAIVLENADTAASLAAFRGELTQAGIALTDETLVTITIPENQSTQNLLRTCRDLIAALPEVASAHTCLTFGTKPISQVMLCALHCAGQMKRELELGGTYYGELKRVGGKPATDADGVAIGTLYNTTTFYRLSSIIPQIDTPEAASALFDQLLHLAAPQEVE